MSKKQKMMRMIISGTMLAAVALVGVTVYQIDMSQQEKMGELKEIAEIEEKTADIQDTIQGGNSTASLDEIQPHYSVIEDEEEEVLDTEHVTSNDVTAQMEENKITEENKATEEKETVDEDKKQTEAKHVSAEVKNIVPLLDFSGELLMNRPVDGNVLMDYSMDRSVYFETLNVYKYNPSILLKAEVGTPVEAAANMKVLSVDETLETGVTVTADLGNGYTVVYGQLKDVVIQEEDVVAAGTVIGYVQEPTKYYAKEGSNLYFAMEKDGASVDPVLYLP